MLRLQPRSTQALFLTEGGLCYLGGMEPLRHSLRGAQVRVTLGKPLGTITDVVPNTSTWVVRVEWEDGDVRLVPLTHKILTMNKHLLTLIH